MSYDQLMQNAKQIEKSAAEAEYIQRLQLAGRAGAMAVDRGEIEAKYENCAQPLFEPFTRIPDPSSYQGLIDDLHSAMSSLSQNARMADPISGKSISANADMEEIETAADSLNGWSGAAAHAFKAKFLDPFPAIASNQFLLLGIMKGAVEADQELWKKRKKISLILQIRLLMRWTT